MFLGNNCVYTVLGVCMHVQNLRIGLILLALCSALLLSCPEPGSNPMVQRNWNTPYHDAIFKATHNSYAASIPDQLDAGARLIEIDLHDDDHASYGYRVGHDSPGHLVFLESRNPSSIKLSPWLSMLSAWSQNNPGHAPITLLFDIKDSLYDSDGYDGYDLSRFNQELINALGENNIYTAFELGTSYAWPLVGELRNKFIAVLSGNTGNYSAYVATHGEMPAVAMNDHGQIIAVYKESFSFDLRYWTGEWQTANPDNKMPEGSIRWMRNRRYAQDYSTSSHPAVAINNAGWIVTVHQGPNQALEYRLGKLTAELDIDWKTDLTSVGFGNNPAIHFDTLDGNTLTVVYTGVAPDTNTYAKSITLDPATPELRHAPASPSNDSSGLLQNKNHAVSSIGTVRVSSDSNMENLLTYTTDDMAGTGTSEITGRIRFFQLAFTEIDPVRIIEGDRAYETVYAETTGRFYADGVDFFFDADELIFSSYFDSTVEHRTRGGNPFLITRFYAFGSSNAKGVSDTSALPNFPAPILISLSYEKWYTSLFQRIQYFE